MDPGDTDAAFAAEAEFDHKAERLSKTDPKGKGSHTGEYDALAARGGVDVHPEPSEEEPLLGTSREGQDPDRKGGAEWEGTKEFDGLPWWRKPSVGSLI